MGSAPTRNTRRKRLVSTIGLVILFLLMILMMDFNGLAKLAHAAVMATPTPKPAVTITSPASETVFGQYTPISITASFAVANPTTIVKVEFYATPSNGTATLIGAATASPYVVTWTPQQGGSYTLTAKAYDVYSQVETSPPVSIFVAVRDPIPLSASVSDPDTSATITKVNFYSTPTGGTATLIGTATQAPYTITWTAPQPGTYALMAQAYDNYPGDYGISSSVNITVTPTPPPGY